MNLSVRTNLVLLTAVAMAGIAVLAITSKVETGRVYAAASYATDKTVPSLLVLDRAATAFATERNRFWQSLTQTDTAEIAKLTHDIHEARSTFDAAFKDYEKLISDEQDRGMLVSDRAAFQAYDTVMDQAMVLAARNKRNDGRDLMMMNNKNIVQAAQATIEAHRQYNKKLGDAGEV